MYIGFLLSYRSSNHFLSSPNIWFLYPENFIVTPNKKYVKKTWKSKSCWVDLFRSLNFVFGVLDLLQFLYKVKSYFTLYKKDLALSSLPPNFFSSLQRTLFITLSSLPPNRSPNHAASVDTNTPYGALAFVHSNGTCSLPRSWSSLFFRPV